MTGLILTRHLQGHQEGRLNVSCLQSPIVSSSVTPPAYGICTDTYRLVSTQSRALRPAQGERILSGIYGTQHRV